MASGYEVAGVDLDSIFAALPSWETPVAATGFEVAGTDLASRYAPLSIGTAAPATKYVAARGDLNTIFAAYGTTQYDFSIVCGEVTEPYAYVGYEQGSFGSISGAGLPNNTITELAFGGPIATALIFSIEGASEPPSAGFFDSLSVNWSGSPIIFDESTATVTTSGNTTTWTWSDIDEAPSDGDTVACVLSF